MTFDKSTPLETAATERVEREIYNNHAVQQILNLLLEGDADELKPVFDAQHGARYPAVEQATSLKPHEIPGLLDRLASQDILSANIVDKAVICEKCGSANLGLRYLCPSCKSFEISRQRTLEHLACGYVDVEREFARQGLNNVICPRCGKSFRFDGPDVRARDSWFYCDGCTKRFRDPEITLACRECDRMISIRDVNFKNIYSYRLGKTVQRSSIIFLRPIREMLEKLGYKTETPGVIQGKSGTQHRFDILCRKDDGGSKKVVVVAINIAFSNIIVSQEPIITTFAQSYDASPDHTILLAVPAASNEAKVLAPLYKITLIEAGNAGQICDKLKQHLLELH